MYRIFHLSFLLVAITALAPATAQENLLEDGLPNLDFGGLGGASGNGDVKVTAEFKLKEDSREGVLSVTATIDEGWHVYSLTQQQPGPIPSVLKVDESDEYSLQGKFTSNPPPNVKITDLFDVPIEEHEGKVTWSASIKLADDVDPEQLTIGVKYTGQVCAMLCKDVAESAEAEFAGYMTAAAAEPLGETYQASGSHTVLFGQLSQGTLAPGDTFDIVITAQVEAPYHIYSYVFEEKNPERISKPTIFALMGETDWSAELPVSSEPPVEHKTKLKEEPIQHFHEDLISWTIKAKVPKDIEPGEHQIEGIIGYQACEERTCDLPKAATFTATITVAEESAGDPVPLEFKKFSSYGKVEKIAHEFTWANATRTTNKPDGSQVANTSTGPSSSKSELSLWSVLPMAFFAGLILNIMPCVLPVIGLKLLSFIKQAGESRRRVFMLNMAYVGGLMSVFLVLACVAVFMRLGWGEQFDRPEFTVLLAAIVFAFALSFLGVWEIPVPGFASTGKISELAESDGISGAFFQGILTTVLATPCAGPLLVPALTWAVQQPALIAFLAYAFVGIGMGFPYIIVGIFPSTVNMLPKPGEWMNTFKYIMGFVLMGTVVLLMTFFAHSYYLLPLIGFMMGLWASLWWVGRVPLYEPWTKQLRAWVQGIVFATIIGFMAFGWPYGVVSDSLLDIAEAKTREEINNALVQNGVDVSKLQVADDPHSNELNWIPFNRKLLDKYIADGKTVFIDFTAPS